MTNAQQIEPDGVEYVNVDVEVGILVQSLMFRHRQRQQDLGDVIGVSVASASRKLRGTQAFSVTELMKIARAYDVDPGDLLPRLDSNQQPCGYPLPLVSADELEAWGLSFDQYATCPAFGAGDNWFDWWAWQERQGWASFRHFRELEALPRRRAA